jgi:ABC-type transport system involved in cytochrome c biogenesis ATPase subunit
MQLTSIRLENVGGFTTTEFDMSRNRLLIGENNSGKTSLLRTIDWLFNTLDAHLLEGRRDLTTMESNLLLPARDTRNRARRIFVRVAIPDGRSARKFGAIDGFAEIRIQFRSGYQYARLGAPTRGEDPTSDRRAIELLERLKKEYAVLYIPAARDGRSELFTGVLKAALRQRLQEELIYKGVGAPHGAPKEIRESASTLSRNAEKYSAAMWKDAQSSLQGGFAPIVSFLSEISPSDLVDFSIEKLEPRFSLGTLDSNAVGVEFLGAGLQSVLSMALAQMSIAGKPRPLILLEEPEAFLHPSAQRTIAHQVFRETEAQVIATTHSSEILAEADPATLVLLRDHNVFAAAEVEDVQNSKDSYLVSTAASLALFDRSILLVEGPGEVAFFESLRRELYKYNIIPPEVLNRMRVVAVGGKTGFGPWVRLLRRFQSSSTSSEAYKFIVCADSVDAGSDVTVALRTSGVAVPTAVSSLFSSLTSGIEHSDNPTPAEASALSIRTRETNDAAAEHQIPVMFSSVDLEYSILEQLTDERASELAREHGFSATTRNELMSQLGSKGGANRASKSQGAKAPYVRARIAEWLHWEELSPNLRNMIWAWAAAAALTPLVRPNELR